jgi:hypothetical protein
MTWSNGAKYEGQWSFGVPSGKGRFTHIDQEVFDGQWKTIFVSKRAESVVSGNGFAWLVYKEKMFKLTNPEPRSSLVGELD